MHFLIIYKSKTVEVGEVDENKWNFNLIFSLFFMERVIHNIV